MHSNTYVLVCSITTYLFVLYLRTYLRYTYILICSILFRNKMWCVRIIINFIAAHTLPLPQSSENNLYDYFCREGLAPLLTSASPSASSRGLRRWWEWQLWAAPWFAVPGEAGVGGRPLQLLLGKRWLFLIVITCEIAYFV